MPDELTPEDLAAAEKLTPTERLEAFLAGVAEANEVWTLAAGEDMVVVGDEGEDSFVVVWPHPDLAESWFPESGLDEVDLVCLPKDAWVDEILPGLQEAGILVLVFPVAEGEAAFLEAADLADLHRSHI